MKRLFRILAGLLCLIVFSSCKKELSCETCLPINPVKFNTPPIASAGADQIIYLPTDSVVVDGSKSTDADNNIIRYKWTKVAGPSSFSILNAAAVKTKIQNLVLGIYQFELQVTDAGNLLSKDTVSITVIDNTLSGQEFIFNDLVWELGDFYGMGLDDVYIGTPARPALFMNAAPLAYNWSLPADVYLKFDTASNWLQVKSAAQYNPGIPVQYLYDIVSPRLYIHVYALNYQLVGRKASIRVKFL